MVWAISPGFPTGTSQSGLMLVPVGTRTGTKGPSTWAHSGTGVGGPLVPVGPIFSIFFEFFEFLFFSFFDISNYLSV